MHIWEILTVQVHNAYRRNFDSVQVHVWESAIAFMRNVHFVGALMRNFHSAGAGMIHSHTGQVHVWYILTQDRCTYDTFSHRVGARMIHFHTGKVHVWYIFTQGRCTYDTFSHRAGARMINFHTGQVHVWYIFTQGRCMYDTFLHRAGARMIHFHTGQVHEWYIFTQGRCTYEDLCVQIFPNKNVLYNIHNTVTIHDLSYSLTGFIHQNQSQPYKRMSFYEVIFSNFFVDFKYL